MAWKTLSLRLAGRRLAPAAAVAACAALLGAPGAIGAAAAAPAPVATVAATSTDLGPADYDGYCKHLGFVRSQIASKEWACLHSDGTLTPLDLQAACEFTYTQRPIAAAELAQGVPYTWQCWAAAPGKVVLPPTEGGGAASSPLAGAVLRALTPSGSGARIRTLVKRGRYVSSFHAPGLGQLSLRWYFKVGGKHPHQTLVARATAMFAQASTRAVAIVLTARGKQLLKHASRLRVSASGSFVANASTPVGASGTFTLRR